MGDPTNDEWWRHDEPPVSERPSASRRRTDGASGRSPSGPDEGPRRARGGSGPYDPAPVDPYETARPRHRPPREGHVVRPETGRSEAASLPNARRRSRSRGGRGDASTSGAYYHEGPARRFEYGASERSGRGGTIPDDRPPRRRPSQQRPLGWSSQNVPQLRETSASNGGWKFRSLNPSHGRGVSRVVVLGLAAFLVIALLVLVVRGISGCVAARAASVLEAPAVTDGEAATATTEAAATTGTDAATDAAATDAASSIAHTVLDEGRRTASGDGRMSFSAVGDNLMNENLLELADGWSGGTGDGSYDFSPLYAEVAPVIQGSYDVSFINQETTLGGNEKFDYAGYPSYNTPDSLADAVADAGWRIVNTDSNHTYDTWTGSIEHAQQVWAAKTGLITVGSYDSEADRQTVRLVECNGIRLAALSYCYGQNGYEQGDLPNDYFAVPYDEDKMREDVARAREVADVVLVYMHWGEEYTNEASDEQRSIAQTCADIGVDMVIGSHAHVIQPVEWVEREGGGKMLVAYGLGDFASGYRNSPNCIMSGMLSCDFVRVVDDAAASDNVGPGGIAVENVVWHPLVEHMAGDTDVVRFVRGYSAADAEANELLSTVGDPTTWPLEKTREVIGDAVTIDA